MYKPNHSGCPLLVTKINCIQIKDSNDNRRINKKKSIMTFTTMNVNGRPKRGRGRGSLTLLHCRRKTYQGLLGWLTFMIRLHPWRGTLHSYNSWSIFGTMVHKHLELVLIHVINPWRMTSSLSLGCLGGGRIFLSSLSFLSTL